MSTIPGGRQAAGLEEKRDRVRRKARALDAAKSTMGLTAFTKACGAGVGTALVKQVLEAERLNHVIAQMHKRHL